MTPPGPPDLERFKYHVKGGGGKKEKVKGGASNRHVYNKRVSFIPISSSALIGL